MFDVLKENGLDTIGVGKIFDIFAGKSVSDCDRRIGNAVDMEATSDYQQKDFHGLCFTNLVDFDMKFGHRRDTLGYKNALEEFDTWLGTLFDRLTDEDMVVVCADHGCDPMFTGSDHTREYIPVLLYGRMLKQGVDLGTRKTFADIGKTVEEYLLGKNINPTETIGMSFLHEIME